MYRKYWYIDSMQSNIFLLHSLLRDWQYHLLCIVMRFQKIDLKLYYCMMMFCCTYIQFCSTQELAHLTLPYTVDRQI